MIRVFCVSILTCILTALPTNAQGFSVNQLIIGSGGSSFCISNPNSSGKTTLKLPMHPELGTNETQDFVLRATGTPDGVEYEFVQGATPVKINPERTLQSDGQLAVVDGQNTTSKAMQYPRLVHHFAEIDIPLMMSNGTYIAKVDMLGVKAGAAISISPSTDMGGLTGPIYAWAPIDCVVMIKFSNPGTATIDPPAMQFAIGAINPMP